MKKILGFILAIIFLGLSFSGTVMEKVSTKIAIDETTKSLERQFDRIKKGEPVYGERNCNNF